MIACTQPLAAKCGLKILQQGGNAAVSALYITPDPACDMNIREKKLMTVRRMQQ
jgi:hypothetical protein